MKKGKMALSELEKLSKGDLIKQILLLQENTFQFETVEVKAVKLESIKPIRFEPEVYSNEIIIFDDSKCFLCGQQWKKKPQSKKSASGY